MNITVDKDLRFYPFFITYDLESLLLIDNLPAPSTSSSWTQEHRPVSFSLCSYVPSHTHPVCENDSDVSYLISTFVKRGREIQTTAAKFMKNRFANVSKQLELECKKLQELSEEIVDESDSDEKRVINTPLLNHIRRIQNNLETYMTEIPVLGYNSSKYDLNLIKTLSTRNAISTCASATASSNSSILVIS